MTEIPIVFLPGSLCDDRLFADQMRAFGSRAQVIDLDRQDSIEEMAAHVLVQAPERFALVGLSLGGIVAVEAATTAPNRVAGLCLLDTNLDSPTSGQVMDRTRWAQMARSGEFAAMLSAEWIHLLTAYPQEHGALIFDMAYEMGPAAFLRQNKALLARRDRRSDLQYFNHPILVGCGADDFLCPPALHEALAARSPHAEYVEIADCGHLSTLDQPAVVTETLAEWLHLCNTQTIPGGEKHEQTIQ
jgi:pimeloyl-ACP methyl ester carboxylesterase